jgi:hypothetical protein
MDISTYANVGSFVPVFAIAVGVITVVVHISFAIAVQRDAESLPRDRGVILVGPKIWFLTTLLGGVFVAAVYWAMHHSRLNGSVPVARADGA